MRLYRKADGTIVGRKDKAGKGAEPIDVPTDKAGLMAYLNDNLPTPANDDHPAFIQGRMAAEYGETTNPYASPDLRAQWERGHALTVEAGLARDGAKKGSFSVRTRCRSRKTGQIRKGCKR